METQTLMQTPLELLEAGEAMQVLVMPRAQPQVQEAQVVQEALEDQLFA
jgi:hypothetical protein